jgi:hypothetical protein
MSWKNMVYIASNSLIATSLAIHSLTNVVVTR